MISLEDDEYSLVNFFDEIDRTRGRSMRSQKIPVSGGVETVVIAIIFDDDNGLLPP
ncbi:MAG TPA: hypothetical protein VKZ54_11780 [Membranihabitans sp.]|nr:hypothetical protein [Membranihabitans sp.]